MQNITSTYHGETELLSQSWRNRTAVHNLYPTHGITAPLSVTPVNTIKHIVSRESHFNFPHVDYSLVAKITAGE